MDIKSIKSAIMFNGYSNEELNSLAQAVQYARSQLGQQVKRQLCVGAQVSFTDNRAGNTYQGVVKKINLKYVHVETKTGLFRVPANMLEMA
jgi:hypothetical protein